MIFIHMDQYDNPEAYKAYGVPGDPWTFVIDGRGVVRFRTGGFDALQRARKCHSERTL
jgi:hypothetical protein